MLNVMLGYGADQKDDKTRTMRGVDTVIRPQMVESNVIHPSMGLGNERDATK